MEGYKIFFSGAIVFCCIFLTDLLDLSDGISSCSL